ncbi:MAG TPA: hypothetical protein DCR55_17190 [Lentisphaeria bacterium]|nr:hypothetical protein [Lentisphaeria bacterium]
MTVLRSIPVLIALLAGSALAQDWTQWRGHGAHGASAETGLPDTWSQTGENLLWSADVGVRSAPLIHKGRVYAISRTSHGEVPQERVVVLDLDTGKVIWEHRFNAFLTDIVAHRLGWSNLAIDPETGYIYAHGIQGLMFCFDQDGEIIWEHSLSEELGRISGYGGRTYSPVVEGDLVIISSLTSSWGPHGKGQHRFFGLDKLTGEIRWLQGVGGKPKNTSYSVPVITTFDQGRIMFTGLGDGSIAAMRPTTGELLWNVPLSEDAIMASVLYHDGKVYAVHGRTNVDSGVMGRLLCLEAGTGKELWRVEGLSDHFATPALHGGLLYAVTNTGTLICLDANTGTQYWTFDAGNEGKGSPVYADGKIYLGDVPGAWRILKVSKAGCQLLSEEKFTRPDGGPDEVYSSPAIADGKVVISTLSRMFCLSTKPADFRSAISTASPSMPKPGPTAHWQLEPAETWLAPNDSLQFRLVGFDAKGTPTGETPPKAKFAVKGISGGMSGTGLFRAGGNRIQAGLVTARIEETTLNSRVRIFPALPYEEDFESLKADLPPPGWITSKLKAIVTEHDGNKVLRKLAERPAPPFARLRCYMTPALEAGYSVQADIFGITKKKRFLPDMGLINSRYLLIMIGSSERTRRLRLVSWAPVPRIIQEVEFPWQGDAWYTAKLHVSIAEGVGTISAKVWKQGTDEPAAWSIQMKDDHPNPAGSPGLYAYAVGVTSKSKGTEVLFDNVIIDRP